MPPGSQAFALPRVGLRGVDTGDVRGGEIAGRPLRIEDLTLEDDRMLDGAAALESDANELKSNARFGQSSDPFNQGRIEAEVHGRHPTSRADALARRRGVVAARKVSH